MANGNPNSIFEQIVRQDDGSYLTTPAPAPLPEKQELDVIGSFLGAPTPGNQGVGVSAIDLQTKTREELGLSLGQYDSKTLTPTSSVLATLFKQAWTTWPQTAVISKCSLMTQWAIQKRQMKI